MRLPVLISVYLFLGTLTLSGKGPEFSQSRDLPPLKLAAADLDTILHKTHSLIAEANGPSEKRESIRESVKLGVRGHEIEILHFSLASSVAFPRELFRFSYTYRGPDQPISSVTIDLGDDSRRISISGRAANQIEAMSRSLENDLLRYSTPIGGAKFRRVVGVCFSVALLISLIVSSVYWWNTRCDSALGMLICSAIALSLMLLVPWDRYLPGFALYQSYSPFLLIRYAPQIFFLSLVAALLGIPKNGFSTACLPARLQSPVSVKIIGRRSNFRRAPALVARGTKNRAQSLFQSASKILQPTTWRDSCLQRNGSCESSCTRAVVP
jgi:hypothetical protein